MGTKAVSVLFIVAMVVVIVGLDILVFRHQFWPRLAANIGVVLIFLAFYFRYLRH